jgi:hypothetical protein
LEEGVVKSRRQRVKAEMLWQRGEVDLGSKLQYKMLALQVFEEGVTLAKEE